MAYGYIAKLNENVERRHVRFNNRFGIAIAADLYTPKELDVSQKYIPTRTILPCNTPISTVFTLYHDIIKKLYL